MTSTPQGLTGKTAIVFASSRGIGRASAILLGTAGANVVVNYAGNATKAQEAAEAIAGAGGKAIAIQADVSDSVAVQQVFDRTQAEFGGVDIVINAAGASQFAPLDSLDTEGFEQLVAVNVRGAFNVLSAAARHVRDGGSVLQFSTGGTKMPVPGGGAYAGTKSAGELMALGLAKELGHRQITVNVISPGVTDTDGLVMPEDQIGMLIQQTPLGRLGKPEDVAAVAAWLVSPAAAWVTGQNIQANGGIL